MIMSNIICDLVFNSVSGQTTVVDDLLQTAIIKCLKAVKIKRELPNRSCGTTLILTQRRGQGYTPSMQGKLWYMAVVLPV